MGHVFASKWITPSGQTALWITQLCVHAHFRNRDIATLMLERVCQDENPDVVGILSSQPFAIAGLLRVFSMSYPCSSQDVNANSTIHRQRNRRHRSRFHQERGDRGDGIMPSRVRQIRETKREPIRRCGRHSPRGCLLCGHRLLGRPHGAGTSTKAPDGEGGILATRQLA